MTQYMLFIRGEEEGVEQFTPEQMQQLIQKYSAWAGHLRQAGKLRDANKLVDNAGHVLRYRDGEIVLDGPFTEAKETIGGYFLVDAEDDAEAIAIARECPGLRRGVAVEIRPIDG
jgi:hypothetical protein